jgi:hypothetical protein
VSIVLVCAHSLKLAAVYLHASLFFGMSSRASCSCMFVGIARRPFVSISGHILIIVCLLIFLTQVLLYYCAHFLFALPFFIGMIVIFYQILTLLL